MHWDKTGAHSAASYFHVEVKPGTHTNFQRDPPPPEIASPWIFIPFSLVIINFLQKLSKRSLLQPGTTNTLIVLPQGIRTSNIDQNVSSKENTSVHGVHFKPSLNVCCFPRAVDNAAVRHQIHEADLSPLSAKHHTSTFCFR